MLKTSLLFCCLALALAAIPLPPPDCPQRLAAAQQAILDQDAKIEAATQALNVTAPKLDRAVDDAAATKSQTSQNLNVAVNKDNLDRSRLLNDQASLQNAKNNLTNIQNNCKSPAPPADCSTLISEAEATIAQWNNVIDRDMTTIQNDDAIVAYNTQLLKQASDAYDSAVASRTAQIQQLQQAIQSAVDGKAAAQKNLEDIEAQCQMFLSENSAAPPADCPTELANAQKAVAAAGDAQQAAIANYNNEMPKLDGAVDQAARVVSALNTQVAADQRKLNHDQSTLSNDKAHLMDAQNNLKNIQTTCGGPAPPADCDTQISKAQSLIQQLTTSLNADSALVAADTQTVSQDQAALANAQNSYQQAVAARDAGRTQLQKAVDDSAAVYNAAEKHYEDVEAACQQLVQ